MKRKVIFGKCGINLQVALVENLYPSYLIFDTLSDSGRLFSSARCSLHYSLV
jgi:hypothetical protein